MKQETIDALACELFQRESDCSNSSDELVMKTASQTIKLLWNKGLLSTDWANQLQISNERIAALQDALEEIKAWANGCLGSGFSAEQLEHDLMHISSVARDAIKPNRPNL